MIADWFAPLDLPGFRAAHLEPRQPHAQPGGAASAVGLLGWETFDRVLSSPHPVDIMTVAAGQLVEVPAPRSAADVRRLMRAGAGVSTVVRASELHDSGLAALAASFAAALPGEVHVQLY